MHPDITTTAITGSITEERDTTAASIIILRVRQPLSSLQAFGNEKRGA
jgi:hypothetical protein